MKCCRARMSKAPQMSAPIKPSLGLQDKFNMHKKTSNFMQGPRVHSGNFLPQGEGDGETAGNCAKELILSIQFFLVRNHRNVSLQGPRVHSGDFLPQGEEEEGSSDDRARGGIRTRMHHYFQKQKNVAAPALQNVS